MLWRGKVGDEGDEDGENKGGGHADVVDRLGLVAAVRRAVTNSVKKYVTGNLK